MNIIFDTNVLVAAFATHGICNSLFEYTLENHKIVISEYIIYELEKTLLNKIKLSTETTNHIKSYLSESCFVAQSKPLTDQISPDLKDDPILGIIDLNHIDYLVSGDKDLLIIKIYQNVPIITPRELWNIFREGK